eukprot:m.159282 g.159282  ORF g.159282 m.159282 type:complete len:145 (+) comp31129_c2_seq10:847-1281(+)
MSKSKVESEEEHDYDEEALKLFEQLKLQLRLEFPVAKYNGLDPIFEHPTSGAKVYVGNLKTAQNRTKLGTYNIQSVVNCQNATSRNFHEKVAGFKYLRFSIANWQMVSYASKVYWRDLASNNSCVVTHYLHSPHYVSVPLAFVS